MRLSPEKQLHLAQLVARRVLALAKQGDVKTSSSEVQIRSRALDTIRAFIRRDEQLAEKARAHVRSMKRDIPEGSAEFDQLYRKFYDEEMNRLRKVMK
jgi:hypothetical protein